MSQLKETPTDKKCLACFKELRRKHYTPRTEGKPKRFEGYEKFLAREFCSCKCANKYNGNAKKLLSGKG